MAAGLRIAPSAGDLGGSLQLRFPVALEGAALEIVAAVAIAAPFAAAGALAVLAPGRARTRWDAAVPLSALPALALAAAPPFRIELPWLFLGAAFGLDDLGRAFLAVTSAVWIAGGICALGYLRGDPRRRRFFIAYGAALGGALGVPLAADAISLYVLFSAMTLASYALVAHERSEGALRAGRVYIAMALFGDVLLFAALAWAVFELGHLDVASMPRAVAEAERGGGLAALWFFGFGVKAGALGLHAWLPLAHPAAPTPASAILSGAVIKVGLLGWLRVLPLGHDVAAPLGVWAAASGALAAYAAALYGALQRDSKTVLAYSSISQMGLATAVLGAALLHPGRAADGFLASAAFAAHHGLAKLALFLGVGALRARLGRAWRGVSVGAVAFAGAALAGAPLTSGAVVKKAMKDAVPAEEGAGFWLLEGAVTLSSAATAVLLVALAGRLRAERARAGAPPSKLVPGALAASALLLAGGFWFVPGVELAPLIRESLQPGEVAASLWPIGLGLVAAYLAAGRIARAARARAATPAERMEAIEERWGRARARIRRARERAAEGALPRRASRVVLGAAHRAAARIASAEDRAATFATGALAAAVLALIFAGVSQC